MSLNLYKPLGDNDKVVRLSAANKLASELLALLDGEHTVKTKSDVDYALSRLTKGLASGRESARPGFAVVLTEFLAALQSGTNPTKWDISLEKILTSVKNNTQSQGHTTGPEERDYHLGRLFGLQSLAQSGITTASESTLPQYAVVLALLFELSNKKPWLRESCAWTICISAQSWPSGIAEKAAGLTYAALAESGLERSSEGVAIWLTLQAYHPSVVPPRGVWIKDSPLNSSNLANLGRILKEAGEDGGIQPKGSWNPKLNFVWELILGVYFDEEGRWARLRKGAIAEWKEVWKVAIDESLFSASSSDERKFHGFLLFTLTLTHITTSSSRSHLASLFTKNFLRSLTNQLSDTSRYLNKVATKCARALLSKAETAPWTVPVIIQQLISNNGTPSFDVQTKSKTVEKVLCFADEGGLVEVVGILKNIILSPIATTGGAKEEPAQVMKTAEGRRQWAADLILTAVRNGKSPKTESWLNDIIIMFASFGHFDIVSKKNIPNPPISTSSQIMFRARLLSCLSYLITIREGAVRERAETWPYKAVRAISTLQKDNNYKLAVEFDAVIEETLKGALRTLERIRKKLTKPIKTSSATPQLSSFELLYSLVILQVHAGETDALGVLEELQICYDKVFKSKPSSPDEEGVDASEVLVEILLGFLSKPSVLLRKLAVQVFGSFVDRVTDRGLGVMFGVLEAKESLGGQSELFDRDSDEDGEDVEMEDGDSDAEVVEMDIDENEDENDEDEGSGSEDGDGGNEDDEDENEDEEEDESEVAKLEAALSEALGAHKATEDDSDSDMDDDAMLALDEQLTNIFKQRSAAAHRSKKQESKQAKETVTNFKNRVLDLLDIFAKSLRARESVAVSTKILLPLLKCARTTGNKSIADRAANVVRNYANSLRGKEGDMVLSDEEKEDLWGLLEDIHKEAAKDGGVGRERHKSACSQASLVVAKICVASGGMRTEDVERVVGVYARSLTMWLTDRSWRVQSGLFTDLVNWAGTASARLQNERK